MAIQSQEFLLGLSRWNKMERAAWQIGLSLSVVWVLYVLVADIVLFQPRQMERYEPNIVSQEHRSFGDFVTSIGQPPSAGTIAQLEARQSRNLERQQRNRERQEYNESYVSRGLAKAFGFPFAWMGALLTVITVFERLQAADERNSSRY